MTVIGGNAKETVDNVVETNNTSAVEETVTGVFKDIDKDSPMDVDAEKAQELDEHARLPGRLMNNTEERVKIGTDAYSPMELVITTAEKEAFIAAMISGDRYRQTFKLFGGRVTVTVRSRTAAETHALYAYIRHFLSKEGNDRVSAVEGDMAYVPLVAQIEELNGTRYPEMKQPLMYEVSDGKEVPPGWYEDFRAWKAKPEGLTSALISCVQLFEYKYWMMTKEAANKNFWNSDTSIEK